MAKPNSGKCCNCSSDSEDNGPGGGGGPGETNDCPDYDPNCACPPGFPNCVTSACSHVADDSNWEDTILSPDPAGVNRIYEIDNTNNGSDECGYSDSPSVLQRKRNAFGASGRQIVRDVLNPLSPDDDEGPPLFAAGIFCRNGILLAAFIHVHTAGSGNNRHYGYFDNVTVNIFTPFQGDTVYEYRVADDTVDSTAGAVSTITGISGSVTLPPLQSVPRPGGLTYDTVLGQDNQGNDCPHNAVTVNITEEST